MTIRTCLLSLLILFVGICVAHALKTTTIEVGYDGVYDGAALVWRDAQGNLLFKDAQLTTPTTLTELSHGLDEHSKLKGLGADDHPQYLNGERHNLAHTNSYNNALSTGPDVNGNVTLGAHLADADIHINRQENEHIYGQWNFTEQPSLANGLLLTSSQGDHSQEIVFARNVEDAVFKWDEATSGFNFNQPIVAPSGEFNSADLTNLTISGMLNGKDELGQPAGIIQNFQQIQGIASQNLLDKSKDEDISGSWDFLDKVEVAKSTESYTPTLFSFQSQLDSWVDKEETVTGLTRLAGDFISSFSNQGPDEVLSSVNIGIRGSAESSGRITSGEKINNFGVVGLAGSESLHSNVIGMVGIPMAVETNRARIGVIGAMDSGMLQDPNSLPQGSWAGYFAGEVKVDSNIDAEGYGDFKDGIKQDGTSRIDVSGNANFVAITGAGHVNATGGALQTNSVTRVDNSGNLVNIGTVTTAGNATLGNGADLITIKDALRLNPVSSWSGTDEGTMYYSNTGEIHRVTVYRNDGWIPLAYMDDIPGCPHLWLFTAEFPTTRSLIYRDSILTGFVGQHNEGQEVIDLPTTGICPYAFVVVEKENEVSYFRTVRLEVNGVDYLPVQVSGGRQEGDYRVLRKGESCFIEFPQLKGPIDKLRLKFTGYYVPEAGMTGMGKLVSRISQRIDAGANRLKSISTGAGLIKTGPATDSEAPPGAIYWVSIDGTWRLHAKDPDGIVHNLE